MLLKNKILHIIILPILLLFLLSATILSWQAQTSWQDGDPFFTQIAEKRNIQVDSLIQLTAIKNQFKEDSQFKFILNGVDWKWPLNNPSLSLPAPPTAEDIDYRSSQDFYFYVITDGAGHRIMEINPVEPVKVWEFYTSDQTSNNYLKYPVAAHPFEENTAKKYLITDKLNHRVIIVNRETKFIEWAYGDKTAGDGPNQLNHPSDAVQIPGGNRILICDQGNNRVLIVDRADGSITWEWGRGLEGSLKVPVDVEYIQNTDQVLVTDQKNHRVLLIDVATKDTSFQFGTGIPELSDVSLNNPTDADMLPNGNIMICDSSNKRLIEINQSKQIVWRFHRSLNGLIDADRLPDNRILIVSDEAGYRSIPARLGYNDSLFVSEMIDLEKNVIFDSLLLTYNKQQDTEIHFQIRSANQDEEITSANWYGPTIQDSSYTELLNSINPIHNGGNKFQFRAYLKTRDPLYTPDLSNVILKYHYFEVDSIGIALSNIIQAQQNEIITNWDSLSLHTILPSVTSLRYDDVQIELQIIDAERNQAITDFIPVDYLSTEHVLRLSEHSSWTGVGAQSIQIKAKLLTANSSITPTIKDWQINWSTMNATKSEIRFVDSDYNPVYYYHATSPISENDPNFKFIDLVRIKLIDNNLSQTRPNIELTVRVKSGLDSATVNLTRQATGEFLNPNGIRSFISRFPDPVDQTLQVDDRDTLIVTYLDPYDPTDVNSAEVVIIQNTQAQIQIVDQSQNPLIRASLNDSIFVLLTNEKDQDLSPAQDTVFVEIFDNQSNDTESLLLVEQQDSLGTYSNDVFFSPFAIRLVQGSTGFQGDHQIQTLPGHQVGASYSDNFYPIPIDTISIAGTTVDGPTISHSGLNDFIIAPNPFYTNQHHQLRLAAISNIGDLSLKKAEIFNLAGERVLEIAGTDIFTNSIPKDEFNIAEGWWNLRNESGHNVSSGTYWVKFSADIIKSADSRESVNIIRKVIIIR